MTFHDVPTWNENLIALTGSILSINPRVEELKLMPTIYKIREQLGCDQRVY